MGLYKNTNVTEGNIQTRTVNPYRPDPKHPRFSNPFTKHIQPCESKRKLKLNSAETERDKESERKYISEMHRTKTHQDGNIHTDFSSPQ